MGDGCRNVSGILDHPSHLELKELHNVFNMESIYFLKHLIPVSAFFIFVVEGM